MTQELWRQIQQRNFRKLGELADFLEFDPENRRALLQSPSFPLNVPRRLAEKMEKNRLDDPLFLQFVPTLEEARSSPGETQDPVDDRRFQIGPKLLHKYAGRSLLLTTSACAMHCRYCFRQNFPYESAAHGYGEELDALRQNPSISEVILSGGDPLSLGDEALSSLLKELGQIPHVERIRFHTRFPIGIPERISNRFLSLLQECPKQIVFVIHTNHPKELDSEVIQALQSVGRLGIPLLNQSVLLRGVNDHPATLLTLCQTLINGGIIPYYLHLLDPVSGTAHFDVPEERGIELIAYLQERLSGYGVPRLAREVPGYPSKIWKK